MTPVSLVRCPGYGPAEVQDSLGRALDLLGGLERFVRRGDRVLVKPNLLNGQPPEAAATTHPEVLDALLVRLLDLGARPSIGDSPAFGWVTKVTEGCGVAEVARRRGVPIVEFTDPIVVPSPRPEVLRQFMVDRSVAEADVVINVPKLKVHRQLGFTGAVKNLYGAMPGKRKAYYHLARGNRDMDFARLIAAFAYTVAPELSIADGVVCMERDGPAGGDPRPVGVLAASADPVAVDTVLADVIRVPEENRFLLDACARLGLGAAAADKIEVLGERPDDAAVADFVHPLLTGVRFSPGRLARSVWRNYLITRGGYATR